MTTPSDTPRLTSRKFLMGVAVLILASLFLAFGVIEPLLWRDVVLADVAAYFTSNVGQKILAAKAGTS